MVSAARLTLENPASESNSISFLGPACGPNPNPTGWAFYAGTHIKVPKP